MVVGSGRGGRAGRERRRCRWPGRRTRERDLARRLSRTPPPQTALRAVARRRAAPCAAAFSPPRTPVCRQPAASPHRTRTTRTGAWGQVHLARCGRPSRSTRRTASSPRLHEPVAEVLPGQRQHQRWHAPHGASTHEQQNTRRSTNWLAWSLQRSASRLTDITLLLFRRRYFLHCSAATARRSSYDLFHTIEDSISPGHARRRLMAHTSKSSVPIRQLTGAGKDA